jgi:hypothetical protein
MWKTVCEYCGTPQCSVRFLTLGGLIHSTFLWLWPETQVLSAFVARLYVVMAMNVQIMIVEERAARLARRLLRGAL